MSGRDQTGKLPAAELARLLERYAAAESPGLLAGPKIGLDAAAVRLSAGSYVLASDPVTYATERIGWYAVHVNANDVFSCGAEPVWFLADVLLPPGRSRLAEGIFRQIHDACAQVGAKLIGGHTELTPGLPRPMVAGFLLGRPMRRKLLSADGARPGDALVLTKGVGIEGTAILARELSAKLRGRLPRRTLDRARRLLDDPGLSVEPEARMAVAHGARAMHDPTEGGLINALWEFASAAGAAARVDERLIPVREETSAICEALGLDPLALLASGALLIACPSSRLSRMLAGMAAAGIPAAEIGRLEAGSPAVRFARRKVVRRSVADEILKALS